MRRFFIHPEDIADDLVQVTGSEARHMRTVLRLQPGDAVEFFDGSGRVYRAILEECGKRLITARVQDRARSSTVENAPLTLAQAVLKGKKMDMLIQKATELGVHNFIPVETRYAEPGNRRDRQAERWQRIMIEACKQCQRTAPMTIGPITELTALSPAQYSHCLIAWENEADNHLDSRTLHPPGPTLLLIGPEGGFHPDEVNLLTDQEKPWFFFSLGSRILRAETASIAAMAIVQHLSGNLTSGGM